MGIAWGIGLGLGGLGLGGLAGGAAGWRLSGLGAGYAAKVACSALFLSGRQLPDIVAGDLADHATFRLLDLQVDPEAQALCARIGPRRRHAVYRAGLGATLLPAGTREAPPLQPPPPAPGGEDPRPWPLGDGPADGTPPELRRDALEAALDRAFAEPHPRRPRRTRAVVVVYRGHIVGERYAPGFTRDTPLTSWSMTKSVTNALAGILVSEGKLALDEPIAAPEWPEGDPRRAITGDQLLRMSSGLRFWEQYWNPLSHVTDMLFTAPAAAPYAASFPLVAAPDTRWSYASGSSNLLSRAFRNALGGDSAEYLAFPRRALFDRLGMRHATLEVDGSGHFVGSSFLYATARDWARFGLLYLHDGLWNGERLLPEGWVRYTRTPTPAAPQGQYGAHFWLNAGSPGNPDDRVYPRVPPDAFLCRGFEEQSTTIIPSRELVVVRMGLTPSRKAWDLDAFLGEVLDCLPDPA